MQPTVELTKTGEDEYGQHLYSICINGFYSVHLTITNSIITTTIMEPDSDGVRYLGDITSVLNKEA